MKVSKPYNISEPAEEDAFLVSASDWERLDEAARCAGLQGSWFNYIASLLIGVAGATGLVALQLQATPAALKACATWLPPALWTTTVFGFLVAVVFLLVARRDRGRLLVEMGRIAKASTRKAPLVESAVESKQLVSAAPEVPQAEPTRVPNRPAAWTAGDRVSHSVFGPGTVSEVTGAYLTVSFDDGAVRKMLSGYAPLRRIDS
jgi:hypothetical protein